jgi:hypothetical protein
MYSGLTLSAEELKRIASCIPSKHEHALRNLRQRDIENLRAGRITRQTMNEANERVRAMPDFATYGHKPVLVGQGYSSHATMWLADALNDMLEAARESRCCPNCERTNGTGSLCPACEVERRGEENAAAEGVEL